MSAYYLRETARMIRETAQAATPGPWLTLPEDGCFNPVVAIRHTSISLLAPGEWVAETGPACGRGNQDAAHIASWSPPVALAVADLLDSIAAWPLVDQCVRDYFTGDGPDTAKAALALARVWRGEAGE